MRRLLSPQAVVSALLALAIIAGLLSFGDVHSVLAAIAAIQRRSLLAFLALMAVYHVLRWAQWLVLLRGLQLRIPLRSNAFAFLVGEIGKSLPIGNYVQSYLLHRVAGGDFALLAAPSTLVLFLELGVALAGLAVMGVGHWDWLRPLALVGLAVLIALIGAMSASPLVIERLATMLPSKRARWALEAAARFSAGTTELLRPRILLPALLLSAAYTGVAGAGLWVLLHGLDIVQVTLAQAEAVYFFSLTAGLISPIPADVGVLEAAGVEAFLALSVALSTAVAAMLLNRALSIAAAMLMAVLGVLLFRAELGRAVGDG